MNTKDFLQHLQSSAAAAKKNIDKESKQREQLYAGSLAKLDSQIRQEQEKALSEIKAAVAIALEEERKLVQQKLSLEEKKKNKQKLLLEELDKLRDRIQAHPLHEQFSSLHPASTPPQQMWGHYKSISLQHLNKVHAYQLYREMYHHIQELLRAKKKAVGRPQKEDRTFVELFAKEENAEKVLILLRDHQIIDAENKWNVSVSNKSEIVALAYALEMRDYLRPFSKAELGRAFNAQFQIQLDESMYRQEPKRASLSFYKKLLLKLR